ncbi:hypothetical protein M406DRAFT_107736 [Cryphonectria parasitica EP155]|uniref:MMS19 nucleotide excision repair protein n=1 Tax=Cryphonectria parasitica (strain ATCC 38755 / EP155) TaxID=660469 RepID=A0A9P5CTH5_CRYP1|nr:uncharacterized protein M406DRAFT_107736 [Cryphonectria parasitica EP155]KAF3769160.1 hypothetical protein M406DRAFT_107736 [Cryphonectria parasitica EP155]
MDNFDLSLTEDLLLTIGTMDPENYTKQLAKTRSEILQLLRLLLTGKCGTYLQGRHQGSEHLLQVLGLAGKERDPSNLLHWFRDLNTILKQSVLSTEVADAAFASFSPFFPISIRRSTAAGPEVTEQQLKDALNSCFSSNGRLAHRTIPFLVEKLDGGASLTAAAKLDILRTIKACVEGYEPIETYVLPYLAQIWSSLKYEVRNGEVPEAIQETLSVFEMSTKRLALQSDPVHLKDFVDTVWNDCAEDFFENPTYTEQLGSILISVARAHLEPLRQISPRIIDTINRAIAQPKSSAHTKTLLLILNNLLRARRQLLTSPSSDLDKQDELMLTTARDIYLSKLKENGVDDPNKEQVEVAKEALEGLAQIVQQPCPIDTGGDGMTSWSKAMLEEIYSTLAFRYMNDFGIRPAAPSDAYKTIETAAGIALRMTVKFYPEGYGNIVSGLLREIEKRSWTGTPPERSFTALQNSCIKAAFIGCTVTPDVRSVGVVNFSIFAGSMLKLLGIFSISRANVKASFWVIHALFEGVLGFIRTPEVQGEILGNPVLWEAAWSLASVENAVKDILPTFPNLVSGQFSQFDPSQVVQLLAKAPKSQDTAFVGSFLQLGIYIVSQLYQTATEEREDGTEGAHLHLSEHLSLAAGGVDSQISPLESQELWRNRYLEALGNIGHTVLVDLGLPAQQALNLGQQIVACFRPLRSGHEGRSWEYHADGVIATMSRGVACAVRPQIVLELGNDIHDLLVGDFRSISELPSHVLFARDQIAYELANKYDTHLLQSGIQGDSEPEAWAKLLAEIQNILCDASDMANMPFDKFSRIVYVLAGALRRGDRFIGEDMYAAISRAPINGGPLRGKHMARNLQLLFLVQDELPAGRHDHAARKRLFQQRLYYQSIRPVLGLAYPLSPERWDSVNYAIYVLHAVKNLTLKQYEENRTEVFRIALAAMQKAEDPSDINAACAVVLQLYNGPIRDHVSTIIGACIRVYQKGLDMSPIGNADANPWKQEPLKDLKPRFVHKVEPIEVRKKSIQLLRLLPARLEEMVLRPHANVVLMHLATVYADKSREVRQLAQGAKNEWIKIGE